MLICYCFCLYQQIAATNFKKRSSAFLVAVSKVNTSTSKSRIKMDDVINDLNFPVSKVVSTVADYKLNFVKASKMFDVKVLKSDTIAKTGPYKASDNFEEEDQDSVFQIQECKFEDDQDLKYSFSKHIKCTSYTLSLVAITFGMYRYAIL